MKLAFNKMIEHKIDVVYAYEQSNYGINRINFKYGGVIKCDTIE